MANRIVTHAVRDSRGVTLAIGNPEEAWFQRHVEWAISDIVSGRHTYQSRTSGGVLRDIIVVNDPDGTYLRVHGDDSQDNNLDFMDQMELHPWEIVLENSEILAVHAALVMHGLEGQILLFGGSEHDPTQATEFDNSRIYDIATNTIIEIPSPEADAFCCGHAFLSDGRLLIGGGTESWLHLDHNHVDAHGFPHAGHWSGTPECAIYNNDGTWADAERMLPEPGQDTRGGGRWYPTLITLGNGDVLAVGGHPMVSDTDPDSNDGRHGSWLPERYNLNTNTWSYQPGHWLYVVWSDIGPNDPEIIGLPEGQESGADSYLYYPRLHHLPNGLVFMASPNQGACGFYNPETGLINEVVISAPPNGGFGFPETRHTTVLLPLLPGDNYTPHVLFFGMEGPQRITLGSMDADNPPEWIETAERDWEGTPPLRRHGCAVLLPTGAVVFVGGIDNTEVSGLPDENAVLEAEIYNPGFDWDSNSIDFEAESWTTSAAASVPRNYHSVALLMPNGRVITAGSNLDGSMGMDDVKEYRIEVFMPSYDGDANRQTIIQSPNTITYGASFTLSCSEPQKTSRVALIRCGSVTHAWDGDQRYIGLEFVLEDNNTLTVVAPPNGNIAPPGPYMIWIIDHEDRPCKHAPFTVLS